MKKIFFSLFSILIFKNINAQSELAVPACFYDDFSGYSDPNCGQDGHVTGPGFDCPYLNYTSGCSSSTIKWYVSHGTPQILTQPNPANNYALMWFDAGSGYGEGMFAGYSFYSNNSYLITVNMLASQGNGNLRVYAANGMTSVIGQSCGGIRPNPDQDQIADQSANNITWVPYTFSYSPRDNSTSSLLKYSQIWIYPFSSSTYYEILVDDVKICPDCNGQIIYNTGSIPINDTKSGKILAGSTAGTGGLGTVTINASQTTRLLAYNEIDLVSDLNISPTGSGSFVAQIINCPVSQQGSQSVTAINNSIKAKTILIYPNPVHDKLNINIASINRGKVNIRIINSLGVIVKNIYFNNDINKSHYEVNVSDLASGIYFVRVAGKSNAFTEKVIKN